MLQAIKLNLCTNMYTHSKLNHVIVQLCVNCLYSVKSLSMALNRTFDGRLNSRNSTIEITKCTFLGCFAYLCDKEVIPMKVMHK